jgi:putative membrane protein
MSATNWRSKSPHGRRRRNAIAAILFAAAASPGFAHGGGGEQTGLGAWEFDPGVVAGLALSAVLYARGLHRLRRATASAHKLARDAAYFTGGWWLLVVALVSPLHPWGRELFAAHMTQHELLMVAAAPLLALGRPGRVFLWAFSKPAARELALWNHALGGAWLWARLTRPLTAWLVHLFALWIWHVPVLFEATRSSELVHALQHASFLFSALWFWHSVFHTPHARLGCGLAVLSLFATALQSGALGALITFARQVWYPGYEFTTLRWGLTPLEDQQLGGLIMWIPAGLVYIVAALRLVSRMLEHAPGEPPLGETPHPTR